MVVRTGVYLPAGLDSSHIALHDLGMDGLGMC